MSDHQDGASANVGRPLLKTPAGWALIGFLAIAAFYLVTEHTAHLFGFLPFAILLACPLMHIFMHHGHGGHHHHGQQAPGGDAKVNAGRPVSSKDTQP